MSKQVNSSTKAAVSASKSPSVASASNSKSPSTSSAAASGRSSGRPPVAAKAAGESSGRRDAAASVASHSARRTTPAAAVSRQDSEQRRNSSKMKALNTPAAEAASAGSNRSAASSRRGSKEDPVMPVEVAQLGREDDGEDAMVMRANLSASIVAKDKKKQRDANKMSQRPTTLDEEEEEDGQRQVTPVLSTEVTQASVTSSEQRSRSERPVMVVAPQPSARRENKTNSNASRAVARQADNMETYANSLIDEVLQATGGSFIASASATINPAPATVARDRTVHNPAAYAPDNASNNDEFFKKMQTGDLVLQREMERWRKKYNVPLPSPDTPTDDVIAACMLVEEGELTLAQMDELEKKMEQMKRMPLDQLLDYIQLCSYA